MQLVKRRHVPNVDFAIERLDNGREDDHAEAKVIDLVVKVNEAVHQVVLTVCGLTRNHFEEDLLVVLAVALEDDRETKHDRLVAGFLEAFVPGLQLNLALLAVLHAVLD